MDSKNGTRVPTVRQIETSPRSLDLFLQLACGNIYLNDRAANTDYLKTTEDSISNADFVISEVIAAGAAVLYEKYLHDKARQFVAPHTVNLVDNHVTFASVNADADADTAERGLIEDQELSALPKESWMRGRMKFIPPEAVVHDEPMPNGLYGEHRYNITRDRKKRVEIAVDKAFKFLTADNPVEPRDLPNEREPDIVSDQFRSYIEARTKITRDVEDKKATIASGNSTDLKVMRQQMHDLERGKPYTFDYEGNILIVDPKNDKLPDTNLNLRYTIEHNAPVADSELSKTFKKKKQMLSQIVEDAGSASSIGTKASSYMHHKKSANLEVNMVDRLSMPMQVTQFMVLSPGVKYYQNGYVKESAKAPNASNLSMTSPDNKSLPLRMSKNDFTEYSLKNSSKGIQQKSMKLPPLSTTNKDIVDNHSHHLDFGLSPTNMATNMAYAKDKDTTNSKMTIKSNELFVKSIVQSIRTNESREESIVGDLKPIHKSSASLKNTIDEFNLKVLGSKEWGRDIGPPLNLNNRPIVKHQQQMSSSLHYSVGDISKYPRERKRKMAPGLNVSSNALPPPPIGYSLGHGISMKYQLNEGS